MKLGKNLKSLLGEDLGKVINNITDNIDGKLKNLEQTKKLNELETLEKIIEDKRNIIGELDQKIPDKVEELKFLVNKIQVLKSGDTGKKIEEFDQSIAKKAETLRSLENRIREKNSSLESLENKIQNGDLEKEIAALDQTIRSRKKYLDSILQDIEERGNDATDIYKIKKEYEDQITAHKQEINQQLQEIEELKQGVKSRKEFYSSFIDLSLSYRRDYPQIYKRMLEDLDKPFFDNQLTQILQRFILELPNYYILFDDQIEKYIHANKELRYNTNLPEELIVFYDHYLSRLIHLLQKKGYDYYKNSKVYLTIIRDLARTKNYNENMNFFNSLLSMTPYTHSIRDVIFEFISISGENEIDHITNTLFLSTFLFKEKFTPIEWLPNDVASIVANELESFREKKFEDAILNRKKDIIHFDDIQSLNGPEFEVFLANLLTKMGYRTEVTKISGDQGCDIKASINGMTFAIQAKNYSYPVGNKAVQEAIAGKGFYGLGKAWVITNSTFTTQAKELADKTDTLLWDGEQLKQAIDHVNRK